MLTAEEMSKRITVREADELRSKMYPEPTTASIAADMAVRIAEREVYSKTQERLREVRGF